MATSSRIWGGPPADSGIYHNGSRSICSDCHDLSTATGSPATAGKNASADSLGPGPANPAHLRIPDVNGLCLSCHDGQRGIPDVMGADANGLKQRSAGEFQDAATAAAGAHGHRLSDGLTCISCHDPHGNGQPRNLRLPAGADTSMVLGLLVRPDARGISKYEAENVAYGASETRRMLEVSALCLGCHEKLSGPGGESRGPHGGFLLHPSYDSREGATGTIADGGALGGTDPGYWNDGTGPEFKAIGRLPFLAPAAETFETAAMVDAGHNAVFCLTCHQAHGSSNSSGLRWAQTGTESVTGCNECHAMGRRRGGEMLTQVQAGGR